MSETHAALQCEGTISGISLSRLLLTQTIGVLICMGHHLSVSLERFVDLLAAKACSLHMLYKVVGLFFYVFLSKGNRV